MSNRPAHLSPPQQSASIAPRGQSMRVLFAMIMREMTTRYGRSAGGYIWAILNPLGFVLILTLVFSLVLRSPELGGSFALFFATGYVPFHVYSDIAQTVSTSVRFNRPLMTYPVVTPLDAILARFMLMLLTLFVVAVILFTGIILVEDVPVNIDLAAILTSGAMAALLGLGAGTINCFLFAWAPTWENIWTIISRPLFLVSGVFFTFESLPEQLRAILWYNPLIHVVGTMRSGFYGSYDAAYTSPLYVILIGLTSLVLGLILLRRHRDMVING